MVCEGNAVSPVDAQRTVACKYARAGQIVARTANGIRQTYEYDKNGKKGGPFYISFVVRETKCTIAEVNAPVLMRWQFCRCFISFKEAQLLEFGMIFLGGFGIFYENSA